VAGELGNGNIILVIVFVVYLEEEDWIDDQSRHSRPQSVGIEQHLPFCFDKSNWPSRLTVQFNAPG